MYDERLTIGYWHYQNFEQTGLGADSHGGEVMVLQRKGAPQVWYIHYYIANEAISRSGRWFAGPVVSSQIADLSPERALSCLEQLDYYYAGGSYFDGKIQEMSGPPPLP